MKIGDKINAVLELAEFEGSSDWPMGFKLLGAEDECIWLKQEEVDKIQEGANPELKKARIQREIEALQKQLEELE